ncbi:ABC transporter permease [Actinocatenispora comari]|uniref:Peptide ABC transporter permease n=1 Tax=Actinocatenispora comari TaxID=2807577 RepID=A0A8J4A4W8_9ACTN|nr:ABC transporter permease [Actinocatenispora comari]GIL25049.1 peptide ABC transporter permease [Actinocatenispora comari]
MTVLSVRPEAATARARAGVWRRLVRRPASAVSLAILVLLVLLAVFGSLLFGSPDTIDVPARYAAASWSHPFGTDELGRDLLSRIAAGGRVSLSIGLAATVIAMILGTVWGAVAAARHGWLDEVLMRIGDAFLAIPMILFALIFVAAFGGDAVTLALVVGLLMAPLTARIARATVLGEISTEYVRGLRAVGASEPRILFREILPNTTPALMAQASLNMATALMVEASLSFLGLGVQPPTASWGTLLQQGYTKLFESISYPLVPALVVVIAIAAFNTVGNGLQRILIGDDRD